MERVIRPGPPPRAADRPGPPPPAADRLARGLDAVARSRLLHGLARAGFLVKGVLYAIIGVWALRAGLARGGAALDVKGAVQSLLDHRGWVGATLLTAAATGLVGLGGWFIVDAAANPDRRCGAWAAISRVGQSVGGLGYAGLAAFALRLAFGAPAGPDGNSLAQAGAAQALRVPGGPLLGALVGVIAVGVGLRQAHLGLTRGFLATVELPRAAPAFRWLAGQLGAFGFLVQGALFALAGAFLVQAIGHRDPGEATSTGGALAALGRLPHGRAVLLVAAVGLLCYALYAGIEGACKRLPGGSPLDGDPTAARGSRCAS